MRAADAEELVKDGGAFQGVGGGGKVVDRGCGGVRGFHCRARVARVVAVSVVLTKAGTRTTVAAIELMATT